MFIRMFQAMRRSPILSKRHTADIGKSAGPQKSTLQRRCGCSWCALRYRHADDPSSRGQHLLHRMAQIALGVYAPVV